MVTRTKKTWQDALAYEREIAGDDHVVLLYHDAQPCGHIYFDENQAEETECNVGTRPSEWIPVLQRDLSAKLEELGLPIDGWS
jgi:hypothetical protein